MRVVGGDARGKRLRGAVAPGVRPTSELVRGAIFNVLSPLDLTTARVLDLYAGSGSLGIEALSRGAYWADFVERHRRQCDAIEENLLATDLGDRAKIYCMDVRSALGVLEGPYELVLMDPPYRLSGLDEFLDLLAGSTILAEETTVVVGHSKRLSLRASYRSLEVAGRYRYGDSSVDFFQKGAS